MEDELSVRPSGIAARGVPVPGRHRTEERGKLPPRFLQFVAHALPDLAVTHVEPSAAFKRAGATACPIRRMDTLWGWLTESSRPELLAAVRGPAPPAPPAASRAMACLPTRCPSRSSGRYFLEKNDVAYVYPGAFAIESRGSDETAPPDPLAHGHTRRVADARVRTTPREVAAGRRARVGVASAPLRGCLAPRATDVRLHRRSEPHARRPRPPGARRRGGGAGGRARAGRHRHARGPLPPGAPGRHSRYPDDPDHHGARGRSAADGLHPEPGSARGQRHGPLGDGRRD